MTKGNRAAHFTACSVLQPVCSSRFVDLPLGADNLAGVGIGGILEEFLLKFIHGVVIEDTGISPLPLVILDGFGVKVLFSHHFQKCLDLRGPEAGVEGFFDKVQGVNTGMPGHQLAFLRLPADVIAVPVVTGLLVGKIPTAVLPAVVDTELEGAFILFPLRGTVRPVDGLLVVDGNGGPPVPTEVLRIVLEVDVVGGWLGVGDCSPGLGVVVNAPVAN